MHPPADKQNAKLRGDREEGVRAHAVGLASRDFMFITVSPAYCLFALIFIETAALSVV